MITGREMTASSNGEEEDIDTSKHEGTQNPKRER